MAHPGLNPLPPVIHHSSTPLSHASAHTMLSSFLSLAELDPSLRPDSVLSERGPTSSSSAADPNLTLAHLGRIKLGMEGKRVGGGAGYDAGGNFWSSSGGQVGVKRKRTEMPREARDDKYVQIVEGGRDAGEPALVSTAAAAQDEMEWQDRENYELAQEDDDEINVGSAQRNPGAGFEDVEEAIGTEGPDRELLDARASEAKAKNEEEALVYRSGVSKVDKAERKRLKKERSKKEKKTAGSR